MFINQGFSTMHLKEILTKFYNDFETKKHLNCVHEANATIPIVWFGDLEKYFLSDSKIATIGLNPSNQEFPANINRFPGVEQAFKTKDYLSVYDGLNKYFNRQPYEWFKSYERIMNCSNWDATYGGNITKTPFAKNYAVHIDFFSAIATAPTWSKLDHATKRQLYCKSLFTMLFFFLRPDIALFSTSKDEICRFFNLKSAFGTNDIEVYNCDLFPCTRFVWGKPNIKPFQGVATTKLNDFFAKYKI